MIRSFRSKAMADLWNAGRSSKLDARLTDRILRRLKALDDAREPHDMNAQGFNFHALKGHKPARYTVHVNGPWCITFAFISEDAHAVDLEQYH